MDKNTSHEAALKLINDIALIDTELAAKIKPSIDMFIESLDSTLSNNELFTQLADFFKLTDDKAKKQWLMQHQELANKINEIFDSMNKPTTTLNEDKNDSEKEDKEEKKIEIDNGETKKDVPITNDDLASDKKEDKKGNEKEDKKEDDKKAEDEEDKKPVEPKDLKLPEDGFKDGKVTMPAKVPGDDKRFMGKTADDLPKPDEMFPPTDPKVVDITKDQVEEIKVPSLATINSTAITKESVQKVYEAAFRSSMNKVLLKHKLIKEAVENDKYSEFLDKCQLDWAQDGRVARFIPIRKYATRLWNQFKDEFASYDEAMAIAKEWYAYKGRKTREADRIIPSNIYVELRKGKDSNFAVNVYLVKTTELNEKDADVASDLFGAFTDKSVYDKSADQIWVKLPRPLKTANGIANVYMISLPFSKDNKRGIILRRVKHDVVNLIRANYKDYYIPTTKIPSWVYSKPAVESSKTYKIVEDNTSPRTFNFFNIDWDTSDFDEEDELATGISVPDLPSRIDGVEIDDPDFDPENDIADWLSNKYGYLVNSCDWEETTDTDKELKRYKDIMMDIITSLYNQYEKNSSDFDNPKDYIYDKLLVSIDREFRFYPDIDKDKFIDAFTDEEVDDMIDNIINNNGIIESLTESVEYKHDEVDELAEKFIADLQTIDANPWDMDVAEFIEWAWGRGNIPREEISYISKRWNIFRTLYAK